MIKLLRNHEVRITLIIYVVLSILVSLVAYLWEKRFGYFVFGVCIFNHYYTGISSLPCALYCGEIRD